ncbi:MAG: histidine phosphotransferase [Caulobacteraceae bacterium]|nr:MAG: histidine phosphotransferase [Caulobacteraceae bacterium]
MTERAELPNSTELAAMLAARLCHDLISPASAVVSGLDLLEDPEQQDMRDDAIALITHSARKLAAVLSFCRVAFGASASADTFDTRDLRKLAEGVFAHHKASLDWQVGLESLNKAAARSILNLAEIGGSCLARGGVVEVGAEQNGQGVLILLKASGDRVRLWPEAAKGLAGERLDEGLSGRWVQSYYLSRIVEEAGGSLSFEAGEAAVTARIQLPL